MTSPSWLVAQLTGQVTIDHGTAGYFHPLYNLLMLPLLAGERTPFQDATSRGLFIGLDLAHARADMARATLEGIGHSMAEAVLTFERRGVPVTSAVAVGGATKNPVIVSTVGAVTGLRQQVRTSTGATYGDAFLAALDCGAGAIGEFGVGTNPALKTLTGDLLIDEKILGTAHIALGRAYPQCGGVHQSAIHWDIVEDLRGPQAHLVCDQQPLIAGGKPQPGLLSAAVPIADSSH